MITETQWNKFKKQLREVKKTNSVIYTKDTEQLREAIIVSHKDKNLIPTYSTGLLPTNRLSVLSIPMDEECIYLSQDTQLTRDLFKDLKQLHDLFYIQRSLDEYIKDMEK